MTKTISDEDKKSHIMDNNLRKKRLSKALRDNLRRRKKQDKGQDSQNSSRPTIIKPKNK